MVSERQQNLLNELISIYIKDAKPVSSELLEKESGFDLCPATIRSEMKKLTDMGYLEQPHTSAGRIPTNKGYRFFVDSILEDKSFPSFIPFIENIEDDFKFIEHLTKNLASLSSSLAFAYLYDKDILWKDGWKEVFNNPEFKKPDFLDEFIEAVDYFEKNIKEFKNDHIKVYIGNEKPFLNSGDFSLIISKTRLSNEDGILAILGPNRMAYDKNINLIGSLIDELEKL